MNIQEEQKRKILRFLSDQYSKSNEAFSSCKIIAKNCGIEKDDIEKLCKLMIKEELIEPDPRNVNEYYKISIDGMILLESYSNSNAIGSGVTLSAFAGKVRQGLDKIQVRNQELEAGVVEVGKKHHLRDGLYYVVLIDISGSTVASSKMKGTIFYDWIKKFIQITKTALNVKQRNLAVYVKSIGDGVLFLFRNFEDILDWKNKVEQLCMEHNEFCKKEGKLDYYQYFYKIIIHTSEIYFDTANFDITAFGVNLVFKIEKSFSKNEIGITDAVRQIILQEINSGNFKVESAGEFTMGEKSDESVSLWKIKQIN